MQSRAASLRRAARAGIWCALCLDWISLSVVCASLEPWLPLRVVFFTLLNTNLCNISAALLVTLWHRATRSVVTFLVLIILFSVYSTIAPLAVRRPRRDRTAQLRVRRAAAAAAAAAPPATQGYASTARCSGTVRQPR